MPEEIRIETASGIRAARVWGPSAGPTVLAVHGWLDNAASFDHLAVRLPELRIVALDLPGHGLSEHTPAEVLYPFVDHVAAVYEVAAALSLDTLSLLGHSLGAGVCSIFAGTFPKRVTRMVLIEGLGPISEHPKHAPERLAKALLEQTAKRGKRAVVHASREAAQRRLLATPSKMKADSVETLLTRGLRELEGGVTWRSDPALRLASRLRLSEDQVLAFLGAIACPTLLIRGDTGYPLVPDKGTPRVEVVPNLQVLQLPGGHHLHLDEPDGVAAAVSAFFADG
ncbi:MAG: alpha/beta hydrolase [Nannocystaceae bacterium]|nr:alpha/beta hydrolase [Nannocystaceae bacterium]